MNAFRNLWLSAGLLAAGWCSAQLGVVSAEYFWDNDPGIGNATPMTAQDGAFNEAIEAIRADITNLPGLGTHVLHMRVKDEDNGWGPTFRMVVEVMPGSVSFPDIRVDEAEYFWDTDPGQGNGTAMLAFDGNFNAALEAVRFDATTLPAVGTHVLGMRARDAVGDWGPVFRTVVEVMPGSVSFPSINVTAAEYWFDIDPGAGSATPMLAFDGNFNTVIERLVGGDIPVPVDVGVHVLWMRSRDAVNDWGPPFGIVVNMDTTIQGTVGLPVAEGEAPVRVFPNPTDAAEGFVVRSGRADILRVEVLDAQGRSVRVVDGHGAAQVEVPLHGVAQGVLPVRIVTRSAIRYDRVVVR
jgi:hypothetical protein